MERAFEKEISVRAISKMCDYSLTWSVTPDFYGKVLVASPVFFQEVASGEN